MLRPAQLGIVTASAAWALLAGGCSGVTQPTLPSLNELTPSESAVVVGSPTEVYERIARGALACWFGPSGPLKANYVYHAQAEPAAKGGNAEIVVHERDRLSDNPKGLRAWRLAIAREKETTTLAFENAKLTEAIARGLEADARRWASGAIGCAETGTVEWSKDTPKPATPKGNGASGKAKP